MCAKSVFIKINIESHLQKKNNCSGNIYGSEVDFIEEGKKQENDKNKKPWTNKNTTKNSKRTVSDSAYGLSDPTTNNIKRKYLPDTQSRDLRSQTKGGSKRNMVKLKQIGGKKRVFQKSEAVFWPLNKCSKIGNKNHRCIEWLWNQYSVLFFMSKIFSFIENYSCKMEGDSTGNCVHGLELAAEGGKFSHRQCADAYLRHQMRTLAVSKYMVSGIFSISGRKFYARNMNCLNSFNSGAKSSLKNENITMQW